MPRLVVKSGVAAGKELDFDRDIVIGRGPMADLWIDDAAISRRHATVTRGETGWFVADLNSGNGTFVNEGRLTEPQLLRDGDHVRFGNVQADFSWAQEPAAENDTRSRVFFREATEEHELPVLQSLQAENVVLSMLRAGESSEKARSLDRRLQMVYDIGAAIGQNLDETPLLGQILDQLFALFPHAGRGVILLLDPENGELTPRASRARSGQSESIAVSRTLARDVIEHRRGVLCADAMGDSRYAAVATIRQLNLRSVVCVPIIARGEVLGIVQLDGVRRPFDRDDMALLLGVAGQAGVAVANARLHAKLLEQELVAQDLALARRIQQRFLPPAPPAIAGYEFRDDYIAALEVGGDYYDFLTLPDGLVGIAIGDVSGKGVSGALYMAKLSSEVRYQSAGQRDPAAILERVNQALMKEIEEGMFVTLLFLVLDPAANKLRIASAGHLEPLVRSLDGQVVPLQVPPNVPLGLVPRDGYEQGEFELEPGDTVVLYTDGIPEATNERFEEFGMEGLAKTIGGTDGAPAEVMDAVLAAVKNFLAGQPQNDDITLLCFGPQAPARARPRTSGTRERGSRSTSPVQLPKGRAESG